MKRQHQRTLEALFSHPLVHGLRASKVEALLHALGADVTPLNGRRLKIRLPGGQETWLEVGEGVHHPLLDPEAVLRFAICSRRLGSRPAIRKRRVPVHGGIRAAGW
jgi:hypothetical protein